MMKNLIALALVAFAGVAFAGEKTQAPAAAPAAKAAVASCDCQPVTAVRRPLLGRRNACAETVLVEGTKKVTTYEPKKVMVEKTVLVPVTKEVKTVTPVKVAAAPVCCTATTVAAPVRRLGLRARGVVAGVCDCAN
jgi:hypothetical protein